MSSKSPQNLFLHSLSPPPSSLIFMLGFVFKAQDQPAPLESSLSFRVLEIKLHKAIPAQPSQPWLPPVPSMLHPSTLALCIGPKAVSLPVLCVHSHLTSMQCINVAVVSSGTLAAVVFGYWEASLVCCIHNSPSAIHVFLLYVFCISLLPNVTFLKVFPCSH
ncbi:hypothetical protein B0H17DRAFT_1111445 [Mycena rosella]|uniref:Uncharacterized protein n=1 Tax=Mycena rosella TaxID=1033263 RepID=A0AAD7BM35_MYCRO|nr:hypothetical protein B0H17DRAFT_1111445 [Mycena rosella]